MAKIILTPKSQDVYIAEYYPNQNFVNFGSPEALFISQFQGIGDDYRSLLQFDIYLSSATISKAELILYRYRNDLQTGTIKAKVFRLLSNWIESTVTWNTQPAASGTAEDEYTIAAGHLGPVKFNITNLVKGWANGSIPNYGVIIKGDEIRNSLIGFRSTRFPDKNVWPKLEITLA